MSEILELKPLYSETLNNEYEFTLWIALNGLKNCYVLTEERINDVEHSTIVFYPLGSQFRYDYDAVRTAIRLIDEKARLLKHQPRLLEVPAVAESD